MSVASWYVSESLISPSFLSLSFRLSIVSSPLASSWFPFSHPLSLSSSPILYSVFCSDFLFPFSSCQIPTCEKHYEILDSAVSLAGTHRIVPYTANAYQSPLWEHYRQSDQFHVLPSILLACTLQHGLSPVPLPALFCFALFLLVPFCLSHFIWLQLHPSCISLFVLVIFNLI